MERMQEETQPTEMSMMPVPQKERIGALDVLRGIALFGILIVNMGDFQLIRSQQAGYLDSVEGINYWFASLVHILFEGKFYPIFSLLFGAGLAIQMIRLEARGGSSAGIMVRRLLVLMAIGALHAIFVWRGDILFIYAVVGLVALLFRHCQPRTLLLWSVGLWLSLFLCCTAPCIALSPLLSQFDSAESADYLKEAERSALEDRETYLNSTYWQIVPVRVRDWLYVLAFGSIMFPEVLMLFLLGMYFVKIRLFFEPLTHRRVLLWMLAGLPIGLLASVIYNSAMWSFTESASLSAAFLAFPLMISFMWLQALGYVALLLWGWGHSSAVRKILAPFAYPGRMALTNYLMQSVICTWLFYGYGLRLAENTTVAEGVGFALGLYVVQVLVSVLWLRHFQYGPMEWLWRVLTYWRLFPIRS